MLLKIFDNNLVAIWKSKIALMLGKPVCIGMCILELSKVLMYEFYYDYINLRPTIGFSYMLLTKGVHLYPMSFYTFVSQKIRIFGQK